MVEVYSKIKMYCPILLKKGRRGKVILQDLNPKYILKGND